MILVHKIQFLNQYLACKPFLAHLKATIGIQEADPHQAYKTCISGAIPAYKVDVWW